MNLMDEMMYPPGYKGGRKVPDAQTIQDKQDELDELKKEAVKAKELIKSPYWQEQLDIWQKKIKEIVGQYNPAAVSALSDAVFGMGMLRQIFGDMNRPQEVIDKYEKKKLSFEKLTRAIRTERK